jgi:hypothetical protein
MGNRLLEADFVLLMISKIFYFLLFLEVFLQLGVNCTAVSLVSSVAHQKLSPRYSSSRRSTLTRFQPDTNSRRDVCRLSTINSQNGDAVDAFKCVQEETNENRERFIKELLETEASHSKLAANARNLKNLLLEIFLLYEFLHLSPVRSIIAYLGAVPFYKAHEAISALPNTVVADVLSGTVARKTAMALTKAQIFWNGFLMQFSTDPVESGRFFFIGKVVYDYLVKHYRDAKKWFHALLTRYQARIIIEGYFLPFMRAHNTNYKKNGGAESQNIEVRTKKKDMDNVEIMVLWFRNRAILKSFIAELKEKLSRVKSGLLKTASVLKKYGPLIAFTATTYRIFFVRDHSEFVFIASLAMLRFVDVIDYLEHEKEQIHRFDDDEYEHDHEDRKKFPQ